MRRIFHSYNLWECYKNGMWRKETKDYESANLQIAIDFTGNWDKYGSAMIEVINSWVYSCENFLSNPSINRKAYVGHAAVCFKLGIPEYLTRQAWKSLSDNQRLLANKKAETAIKSWEQNQRSKTISQPGKNGVINQVSQTRLLWN